MLKAAGSGTPVAYNPAGQIVSLTRSNDAYAWNAHSLFERDYAVNGLNQYTSAGGVALGYDARGNLTASGPSTFGYSRLNELTSAPNGTGGTAQMTYDPKGRLTRYDPGTQLRMVYAGPNLVTETTATGTVLRRYVHGPGVDEPIVWYEGAGTTDRRWLQADQLGSVVAVSNASGTMLAINRYDEYGIPQAGNVGRFAYTGQTWFGEVGLYNYKARWYSPSLGRFMQTDPIGYKDNLNLYAYVGNDPVNKVDPTGLRGGTALDGCDPEAARMSSACGGTLTANGTSLVRTERISANDSNGKANAAALGSLISSYSSEAMKLTEDSDFTREYGVTASLDKRTNEYVVSLFRGPSVGLFEAGSLQLEPTERQLLFLGHTHTGLAAPGGSGGPVNSIAALLQGRKAITIGPSDGDVSSASEWRKQFPGAQFRVFFQSLHGDSSIWISRGY